MGVLVLLAKELLLLPLLFILLNYNSCVLDQPH